LSRGRFPPCPGCSRAVCEPSALSGPQRRGSRERCRGGTRGGLTDPEVLKVLILPFARPPVISEPVATLLMAFCVVALLMPLLNWVALRWGHVDHPNSRKIHAHPIPLLGGVGVYADIVITLWLR